MRHLLALSVILAGGCRNVASVAPVDLSSVRLPPGFHIDRFAGDLPGARSLALGAGGTVFVGTRDDVGEGRVYAVADRDGDGRAEATYIIAHGLFEPNGVAFRDGALYVAEVSRVWRYDGIEAALAFPPSPVLVSDAFPTDTDHGWKYLRFAPDGRLYIPIGSPCNVCLRDDPRYGSIMRMNADGSGLEIFARGIRNTVGF